MEVYNADSRATSSPGKAPKGEEWTERARRNPPDAVTAHPDPDALNTGILCDGLRAIDIDIDNPTIAHAVRTKALARFGECPMRIRGSSPRCLLLYRAAEGEPRKRTIAGAFGKVEILGRGQQFVAFGTHPSGGEISWMPEAPGDTSMDALTPLTEQDIDAFLADAADSIGAKHETPQTDRASPQSSRYGLRADTLQVITALSAIPNDGAADWEAWNRIGMAIWAATGGGEGGRAAFHAWSEPHSAYDPVETDRRWDHYRTSPPTQIGAGTLFHLAKKEAPAQQPLREQRPEPSPSPLVADSLSADKNSLSLVWFGEIEPLLDVRDFVQGLLIEEGSAVVYGKSNAGKTFFVTDLALHVAAGFSWRGKRVEQGGVVYCVLEGGAGFRNRVWAWKIRHGLDDKQIPFASIQSSLDLRSPEADTPRLIHAIEQARREIRGPVKLVVIDTLARAMAGGNENSPEDMGALVMNMDMIRAATKAMVLWIHHSGKDEAKGSRGHSSLQAAIDTEIEVVADDGGVAKAATVVKQRELQKGDVFQFGLEVVELDKNRHGEPVTTCIVTHGDGDTACAVPSRRRLKGHNKRALEVLADLVATSGKSGVGRAPANIPTVPSDWWRERFYKHAMPGAEAAARKMAFRRASDFLVAERLVGMADDRVWVVNPHRPFPEHPREQNGEQDG